MTFSLRRRLLLFLTLSIACVWFAAAAAAAWQTYREVQEVLDASLSQAASVIFSLVSHEMEEHRARSGDDREAQWARELHAHLPPQAHAIPLLFQVGSNVNDVEFRSPGAPQAPLSDGAPGYSDHRSDAGAWRVFTLHDAASGVTVRAAEPDRQRALMLRGIVERMAAPLLAGIVLLAGCIWLSVGRGLRPLFRVTRLVERRDPFHLSPLGIQDPPEELAPLVAALDRLFARLDAALEGERRFTADAAHELRTPLAGIRAQAQVALGASDEAGRVRALGQLLAGVDRAARLIEQLLALARFDAYAAGALDAEPATPTELAGTARRVLAALGDTAARRQIALQLDAARPAWVDLHVDALEVLLRNLVDNAIRYSPPRAQVAVRVAAGDGRVRLAVEDSGPGIAVDERDQVFARFRRGRGVDTPGSGLGLSIVSRIAAAARADVRLGTAPGGGLSVVVEFAETTGPRVAPESDAHGAGPAPQTVAGEPAL